VAPGDRKAPLVPKPPKMKKHKAKCFKMGEQLKQNGAAKPGKLAKAYYKQLKAQENGINSMTVGEYLNNRRILKDLVAEHGPEKARDILTGGGRAQVKARKQLEEKIFFSVQKRLKKRGFSTREAARQAQDRVDDEMKKLAALHNPDLIAGGKDEISKMGNRKINSSIGAQWPGRVGDMDKAATQALATHGPDAKMNVELAPCTGAR